MNTSELPDGLITEVKIGSVWRELPEPISTIPIKAAISELARLRAMECCHDSHSPKEKCPRIEDRSMNEKAKEQAVTNYCMAHYSQPEDAPQSEQEAVIWLCVNARVTNQSPHQPTSTLLGRGLKRIRRYVGLLNQTPNVLTCLLKT